MHSRHGLLVFLIITQANLLGARPIPVVVQEPLCDKTEVLKSAGFQLHARCGDMLIGTLPSESRTNWPDDALPLPDKITDFSNIYQVDKRALASKPALRNQLRIIFETEGWILICAEPTHLNALSSAGVHFRAIPEKGYSLKVDGGVRPDLDSIDPFVGVILDQISSSSYENYLQTLEDFITRNTYNPECDSAAFWILEQFQSMGLPAWLDSFQIGTLTRYNVIAELTGTQYPDQIYYITAHYDATAGLPVLPEPVAPGADDDGSGAAAVLECARVMAQFSFQKTVRFAVFAGNEQGLIGSEAYVAGLPQTGETYLGTFNADMVGWSGEDAWPPDLVIYTNDDTASIALADKLIEAISTFVPSFLEPIPIQDATMVYADHAPFWDRSIPAVLAMEDEAWGIDLNPYYHSVDDLVQYLDIPYALHVLEAILASAADLALPNGSTEPHLTAGEVAVNDSLGNNNGQIEYGESIFLTIPVINAGGGDALAVAVVLSESDPYITFSDWVENYGLIAAGDTVEVPNAFAADVTTNVPDEHLFNVAATMSWAGNQWVSTVQMIAHAPDIAIEDLVIDDNYPGNGNGRLEPGETADLEITLFNEGSFQAQNLTAALSCPNTNISINTSVNSYGTLPPETGAMREYSVSVLPNAPAYFLADFTLTYNAAGGWTDADQFTLDVGDITHTPTGPDTYGYTAYDINDEPYGPVYNWIEIDPELGGPGTLLDFDEDDQTLPVSLPFTFVYYGLDYTGLSVCSNGWIACGLTGNNDHSNSPIPDQDGPPAMIAPFWEDLSPQHEGTVSYYFNSAEGLFIVEYNGVRDFYPSWDNMTFEVILYDPAVHPTSTGDGKILYQYGELDNTSSCTVGIENHSEDDGILYLYNTSYPSTASPIGDGMAILFTTGEAFPDVVVTLTPENPPIVIPATGGSFSFNIAVANNEPTSQSFNVWCNVTLPSGASTQPLIGPVAATFTGGFSTNRDRTQAVPAGAPAGNYSYNAYVGSYPGTIWNSDSFGFEKLETGYGPIVDNWDNWGESLDFGEIPATVSTEIPDQFRLGQNYPNPFNPATTIRFELPEASVVNLVVYDVSGRRVAELVDGWRQAGSHDVTFDGSDLASGVYIYRITAGDFSASGKMVLMK